MPSIPHYSNISRRINRLDIKISDDVTKSSLQHDDYFVIAIDSTGIKVTNRGEWIRHRWNVKRGYLKIHLAVDIKKKRVLSLKVTSEQVHDGKVLPELIDDIIIKQNKVIETAIMDGSYDSNNNFQFLSFRGIKPARKSDERILNVEKPITISETRMYNHRKPIYNNGRIALAMVRDGLSNLFFPVSRECLLENMLLLLDLKTW